MAFTHTVGSTWSNGSRTLAASKAFTNTAQASLAVAVSTATTDEAHAFPIDVSQVKSFYAYADGAITLETNSGATPDNTLVFVANEPYVWHTGSLDSFLITADVTATIYLTNASGATVNLYIEMLYDSTP